MEWLGEKDLFLLTDFKYHYPFVCLRLIYLTSVQNRCFTALAQQTTISEVTSPELRSG